MMKNSVKEELRASEAVSYTVIQRHSWTIITHQNKIGVSAFITLIPGVP